MTKREIEDRIEALEADSGELLAALPFTNDAGKARIRAQLRAIDSEIYRLVDRLASHELAA